MRHRSRATLGFIVQGLLAAGLCALAAAAQQAATSTPPVGATVPMHAPNPTTKDAVTQATVTSGNKTLDTFGPGNDTGVSNPDPVTPEASSSSNEPNAEPVADSKPAPNAPEGSDTKPTKPVPQAGPQPGYALPAPVAAPSVSGHVVKSNDFPTPTAADPDVSPEAGRMRFFPDQPPAPLTPDHDSDKPTPPDPPTQSAPAVDATNATPSSPPPAAGAATSG